jgi:Predicted nucleotide-binding protein containing TIR-like domain
MDTSFKVLVSAPQPKNLSPKQQQFLAKVNEKVDRAGLRPVELDDTQRLEDISGKIRKLQGVMVMAFGQWQGQRLVKKKDEAIFPTEFSHLHMALAAAAHRPLLILKEKSVSERGALRPSLGCRTVKIPSNLDPAWLGEPEFEKQFEVWLKEVKSQCDVFLGYSRESNGTAAQVQLLLEQLGATVVNWAMDFSIGASILSEIESARTRCTSGIFLFTEDDPLEGRNGEAAPRDNVVFEAGYFMSAKGAEKCLIIREGEAKMPADLGGAIYAYLKKGADVTTIEGRLANFLKQNL